MTPRKEASRSPDAANAIHAPFRLGLLFSSILFLASIPAGAQMDEYSIKAGYLYNFSKYVGWPQDAYAAPDAPLAICIVGEDPFEGKLDQAVSGRTAGDGRRLAVKRMRSPDATGIKQCQVLFLCKSEKRRAVEIINMAKGITVFTVADFTPFAELGGIADLRIEGTKVKIALNVHAASAANLKVSGKLQQVANLVQEGQ